jgi:hypothetical protein
MDETMGSHNQMMPGGYQTHTQPGYITQQPQSPGTPKMDPPEDMDQPPSLSKSQDFHPVDPAPVASPGNSQFNTDDKGYISPASADEFSDHYGAQYGSMQDPDGGFSPSKGYKYNGEQMHQQPNGHFPMSPGEGVDEEKKNGHGDVDSVKSGEDDFMPIKRDGYKLKPREVSTHTSQTSPSPGKDVASPSNNSQDSGALSRSSALRGAQELLRKNRQRRLESALRSQGGDSANNSPQKMASPQQQFNADGTAPSTSIDEDGTWDSGSELTSVVSGSSAWTDDQPTERNSRRALILQMAKARMKSNKEAQNESKDMGAIFEHEEVGPDDEIPRVSSAEERFNLVQDLD